MSKRKLSKLNWDELSPTTQRVVYDEICQAHKCNIIGSKNTWISHPRRFFCDNNSSVKRRLVFTEDSPEELAEEEPYLLATQIVLVMEILRYMDFEETASFYAIIHAMVRWGYSDPNLTQWRFPGERKKPLLPKTRRVYYARPNLMKLSWADKVHRDGTVFLSRMDEFQKETNLYLKSKKVYWSQTKGLYAITRDGGPKVQKHDIQKHCPPGGTKMVTRQLLNTKVAY